VFVLKHFLDQRAGVPAAATEVKAASPVKTA
jgi:hypothetical protein